MKKTLYLLVVCVLSSCATVYLSPNGQQIALNHQKIAILKPQVKITANKKIDAKAILENQKSSSYEFQQEIYKWFLKKKTQNKFTISVQDVAETNALLSDYEVESLTNEEICKILNVDGIVSSNFSLSKPVSVGGAVALDLLFGVYASTNQAVVSMSIKTCSDNSLIWKYDHKYEGGILSSPSSLISALMRDASRKMPYNTK